MTTASAHQAMVEALRAVTGPHTINPQRGVYHLWSADCPRCNAEAKLRAALEGWEKRPTMADDKELREKIGRHLQNSLVDTGRFGTAGVLAIIDAALFGTGPRTGGERG